MRFHPLTAVSIAFTLFATDAGASEVGQASSATATLARHHTNNALDGPLALADWYTVLRGALEETLEHGPATTRLAAEFELRRYDTYTIEDDAAFGIAAETTVRASDRLELRGTLSLKMSEEGDNLALGDVVLGTRTAKTVLAAGLQAGILLAPDTTLVLEGSAAQEKAGDTRFQDNLVLPIKLEPDRRRLRLGATLIRKQGPYSYGASAATAYLRADQAALLPDMTLAEHTAMLRGAVAFGNGATVAAAAGAQMLHLVNGPFRQVRPAFELAAATPLPAGFSLRGSLKGGYDTASPDDPMASWARRAELEAGYRATETVRLGAGIYEQMRDNLALENRTTARGLYGEVAWQAHERLAVLLRIDAARHFLSAPDLRWRVLDARLAVTVSL